MIDLGQVFDADFGGKWAETKRQTYKIANAIA